jgi:hypothetical protein
MEKPLVNYATSTIKALSEISLKVYSRFFMAIWLNIPSRDDCKQVRNSMLLSELFNRNFKLSKIIFWRFFYNNIEKTDKMLKICVGRLQNSTMFAQCGSGIIIPNPHRAKGMWIFELWIKTFLLQTLGTLHFQNSKVHTSKWDG